MQVSIGKLSICSVFLMVCAGLSEETPDSSQSELADSIKIVIDGSLHTPREILLLVERSNFIYEIGGLTDSQLTTFTFDSTVLPPALIASIDSSGAPTYQLLQLSDSGQRILNLAEAAFTAVDYQSAIEIYHAVLAYEPGYDIIYSFLGDAFYRLGTYDSSTAYFEEAISLNPNDYQRRWFYADMLWEIGDTGRAINQMTRAHLLNVFHINVLLRLRDMRSAVGRPWTDWSVLPLFDLSKDYDTLRIASRPGWFGYAFTKALWKYEPGYAENMTKDKSVEQIIPLREEKEALVCAMVENDSLNTLLVETIGLLRLNEFILYEIIAKRNPHKMLLLDEPTVEKIITYLDQFH